MRRLIDMMCVLTILILFLLFDFQIINRAFATSAPSAITSWIRALPLQPTKRSVYVEWATVSGVNGYYLQCANSPFSANTPTSFVTLIQINSATTTSYTHNNLLDNYWYTYRAVAYDANGVNAALNVTPTHGVAIQPVGLRWEETY